jgi:hypothetical protein
MDSNHLFSGMCPGEYEKFDDLLGATQKVLLYLLIISVLMKD